MKKKFFNENIDNNSTEDIYNFEKGISSNVSGEQHSEYSDHIYVGESKSKEQLYDRNNPIVKTILIVLGLFVLIGSLYYILTGLGVI